MVGSRIAMRAIGLVSTVFLARLLRPEDFGLVALAMALVAMLEVLGNFSFDLALIRDGRATRGHYDTVWTLTLIRGVMVGAVLAALAGPAASFLGDTRVEPVIYWLAAATVIEGLQNVGMVDFRKELLFHREFIFQVLAKLASFATTLTLALLWRQYWALVFGIVAGKIANVILSYLMHPHRPRLTLSEWRALVGFSKWLLASNVSFFLSSRLDTFVVGRIAGAHALGLYEVSNEISNLPAGELIWPIQRALYPGYALLSRDDDRLPASYIAGMAIIAMIAMPAAVGIASVAGLIVAVFLGEQWSDAVPLLQVLAIAGVLKVGYANVGPVLVALGRAKLMSHLGMVNLAVLTVLIIGGATLAGPIGTAYSVAIASGIMLSIYIAVMLRLLAIPADSLIRATWRTGAAVIIMACGVRWLCGVWPQNISSSPTQELMGAVVFGVVIYVAAHVALWRVAGSPEGAEKQVITAVIRWRGSGVSPVASLRD
jgi:lipopolysaccharide exporter